MNPKQQAMLDANTLDGRCIVCGHDVSDHGLGCPLLAEVRHIADTQTQEAQIDVQAFTKVSPFFSCRGTNQCRWCRGWEAHPQMDEAGHGEDKTVGHLAGCAYVALLDAYEAQVRENDRLSVLLTTGEWALKEATEIAAERGRENADLRAELDLWKAGKQLADNTVAGLTAALAEARKDLERIGGWHRGSDGQVYQGNPPVSARNR